MFLEGKTPSGIEKHLTANKIPTPPGKKVWQQSTVFSILWNQKRIWIMKKLLNGLTGQRRMLIGLIKL